MIKSLKVKLKKTEEEKAQLEYEINKYNHFKRILKNGYYYKKVFLKQKEKMFLKYFDKMNKKELAKKICVGKSCIYVFPERFEKAFTLETNEMSILEKIKKRIKKQIELNNYNEGVKTHILEIVNYIEEEHQEG